MLYVYIYILEVIVFGRAIMADYCDNTLHTVIGVFQLY